jgi:hypothetical protein
MEKEKVIQDMIRLVSKEKEFVEALSKAFPLSIVDIYSLHESPNCSCRKKIVSLFENNFDAVYDIYVKIAPQTIVTIPKSEVVKKPILMAGQTMTIFPEEYEDLILNGMKEKWAYRGIAIIEKENKLKLFFY